MRLYKLNESPYDMSYIVSRDTPKIWWLSVDDIDDSLQQLALLIHNITPHSAACERIFSTLGWIYGKRRLRLSVSKIEGMAKIRSYYISMINKELKYINNQDYDINELKIMVQEVLENEDEDDNEDNNNNSDENEIINEELEIPNHDVFVIIENIFNLEEIPFILDSNDINDDMESIGEESNYEDNENNNNNESNQIFDYNIENIATKYID